MSNAKALVAEFKANPNRLFSDSEAEALAGAAGDDLWAAKAAAMHFYRKKDLPRSLELMASVAEREPTGENIKNVAVAMRAAGRFKEAVQWLEARQGALDPIELNDLLCSLATRLKDYEKAVRHGDEALRLKDAAAPRIEPREPLVHAFDPEKRTRNVIAFSLWGSDPRYLRGALTNATVARYLYPGWTARFYVDSSVPEPFRKALAQNGAEIVLMDRLPAAQFGLFWRFLVEDDESVDIYIVRDADSVLNVQERWAVGDWLKSGKAFHVMRDSSQHSELVLAGMWGAHRGNFGGMERRVREFVASAPRAANYVVADQHFLRQAVWPVARSSVCIHDSHFNFMSPRRFSADFSLPSWMHVGQNDWVHFKAGK
ncbi:MAG TPA: hypothetical protein VD768_06430 [Sphingomicrobium sp.]|nr:hypothetical protein [Sphingomicrobium sp.]